MKLLKIIQTVAPDKARIIDEITDFHPGYGVNLGWSWYVGGMRDTGDWNIDKLIETPQEILEDKLNHWKLESEEHDKKQKEHSEWWEKATSEERRQWKIEQWDKERESWNKIVKDREMAIMWGKPKSE